jgi:hypothetical protein
MPLDRLILASRGLRLDELGPLLDALRGLPDLAEPNGRNAVLRRVNNEMRMAMPVERGPYDRLEILSLFEACQKYTTGVTALLDVLELPVGSEHAQFKEVMRLVGKYFESALITRDELDRLQAIVRDTRVAADVLTRLHRASQIVPVDPPLEATTLADLAIDLARRPPQSTEASGVPRISVPLLEFVERLALHLEPSARETAARLQAWTDPAAARRGVQDEVAAWRARGTPALAVIDRPAPAVLVQVEEVSRDSDQYEVRIWQWQDERTSVPLYHSEKPLKFAEVKAELDRALEKADTSASLDEAGMPIEVLLPFDRFCEPIDQWVLETSVLTPQTLGVEYLVAIRSLDRVRLARPPSRIAPKLRALWRVWWQRVSQSSDSPVVWVDENVALDPTRVHALLRQSNASACVALAFRPPGARKQSETFFLACFGVGAAVALWPRTTGSDPQLVRNAIEELLAGRDLAELPSLVRQMRNDAALLGEEYHLGRDLTLLWDDPRRLPPDTGYQYAPPAPAPGGS